MFRSCGLLTATDGKKNRYTKQRFCDTVRPPSEKRCMEKTGKSIDYNKYLWCMYAHFLEYYLNTFIKKNY